jgi:hypothetical protein
MEALKRAILKSAGGFILLGATIIINILLFSTAIWIAETSQCTFVNGAWIYNSNNNPTPYQSIYDSFYWNVITITTVGYGDVAPLTRGGRAVACLTAISGLLMLAFPLTIFSLNFQEAYVELTKEAEQDFMEDPHEVIIHHNDKLYAATYHFLKELQSKMAPYKGSKIIAYHNEWVYFETRFGLQIVDFMEPKPGIPPTPSQLVKVIKEVTANKIKVIISSPYFTTSSSDVVSKQTGVKELTLATSVGAFDSIKDYFGLFDYNIDQLITVLK